MRIAPSPSASLLLCVRAVRAQPPPQGRGENAQANRSEAKGHGAQSSRVTNYNHNIIPNQQYPNVLLRPFSVQLLPNWPWSVQRATDTVILLSLPSMPSAMDQLCDPTISQTISQLVVSHPPEPELDGD